VLDDFHNEILGRREGHCAITIAIGPADSDRAPRFGPDRWPSGPMIALKNLQGEQAKHTGDVRRRRDWRRGPSVRGGNAGTRAHEERRKWGRSAGNEAANPQGVCGRVCTHINSHIRKCRHGYQLARQIHSGVSPAPSVPSRSNQQPVLSSLPLRAPRGYRSLTGYPPLQPPTAPAITPRLPLQSELFS
jgi:hypothetical protein